ncbi:MAG: oxygen-independent coproporphyrinogen III oxidase [Clostridiales bacterium]|nr:oxygen-independent coproporphyrinogen III oxidase [Clostridiales bacterium]
MNKTKSMGMYIHIPFCMTKCKYCDFLSFPCDEPTKRIYVDSLKREILAWGNIYGLGGENRNISTIFIGGGTPSYLDSNLIFEIMKCVRNNFYIDENAEITIECNPGTLNLLKLSDFKSCGINRLSIGLQSANDNELKAIGRIHSFTQFKESFLDARTAGFDNINIDLMTALPYQTLDSLSNTLDTVIELNPEHISAYSLILEEHTPLYDYINLGHANILPDENIDREMYYLTKEKLLSAGYERYEISNYSKPNYASRHNLSYWNRTDYLGVGLGASSFIDNVRYKNEENISAYLLLLDKNFDDNHDGNVSKLKREITTLNLNDSMEEFMFLGLRKESGISISEFSRSFNKDIFDVYGNVLDKYSKMNLLNINNGNIKLTAAGFDVSNTIFCDFLLD